MTTRRPNYRCVVCKTPFYCRPSQLTKSKSGKAYCSPKCFGEDNRKSDRRYICIVCDKPIPPHNSKVGRKTCSRACANRSRTGIKYKQGSYKNRVKQSRALRRRVIEDRNGEYCEECGYNAYPEVIQIHHIIERSKGGTDDLDNLMMLCPTCHMVEHFLRKKSEKASE